MPGKAAFLIYLLRISLKKYIFVIPFGPQGENQPCDKTKRFKNYDNS